MQLGGYRFCVGEPSLTFGVFPTQKMGSIGHEDATFFLGTQPCIAQSPRASAIDRDLRYLHADLLTCGSILSMLYWKHQTRSITSQTMSHRT